MYVEKIPKIGDSQISVPLLIVYCLVIETFNSSFHVTMSCEHMMALRTVYSFQTNDLLTGKRNFRLLSENSVADSINNGERNPKRRCLSTMHNYQQPALVYQVENDKVGSRKRSIEQQSINIHDNFKKSRVCSPDQELKDMNKDCTMMISDSPLASKNMLDEEVDVWNYIGIG